MLRSVLFQPSFASAASRSLVDGPAAPAKTPMVRFGDEEEEDYFEAAPVTGKTPPQQDAAPASRLSVEEEALFEKVHGESSVSRDEKVEALLLAVRSAYQALGLDAAGVTADNVFTLGTLAALLKPSADVHPDVLLPVVSMVEAMIPAHDRPGIALLYAHAAKVHPWLSVQQHCDAFLRGYLREKIR